MLICQYDVHIKHKNMALHKVGVSVSRVGIDNYLAVLILVM